MKSRLTAVLSVTGVLAAGASAALVNTQVLRHTSESAMSGDTSGAKEIGDGTIGTVVLSADAPTTTSAAATLPAGVSAATAPASTSIATAYRVGSSGTVVLDAAGGLLTIVSVTPSDGWVVADTLKANPTHARVVFETATTQVIFDANLLYGVVGTSVTVNAIGGTTGGGSGGGSGGTSTSTTVAPSSSSTTTVVEPPDDTVVDDD